MIQEDLFQRLLQSAGRLLSGTVVAGVKPALAAGLKAICMRVGSGPVRAMEETSHAISEKFVRVGRCGRSGIGVPPMLKSLMHGRDADATGSARIKPNPYHGVTTIAVEVRA